MVIEGRVYKADPVEGFLRDGERTAGHVPRTTAASR